MESQENIECNGLSGEEQETNLKVTVPDEILRIPMQKFCQFYANLYGTRFVSLLGALQSENRYCALVNPFVLLKKIHTPENSLLEKLSNAQAEAKPELFPISMRDRSIFETHSHQAESLVFANEDFSRLPAPEMDELSGLMDYYALDPASLLPVWLLLDGLRLSEENEIKDEEHISVLPPSRLRVLDMCSAPGGKAFAISFSQPQIQLTCNENSRSRRFRLSENIRSYLRHTSLPLTERQLPEISVTGENGEKYYRHYSEHFDGVLIDAPCSGERHILQSSDELQQWTQSRTKTMAKRQLSLLLSALRCVKPGGIVVYSTCSISPYENDGVIQKALTKSKVSFSVEMPSEAQSVWQNLPMGEKTEYGCTILPDNESTVGWGPIYACRLRRNN